MAKKEVAALNVKELRKKTGLNQTEFWARIGVTQSGGSRYESGRNIPAPTKTAVELAYGKTPLKVLAKLREVTLEALIAGGK